MHVISQMLTYYEKVRTEINKDPGAIFGYFLEEERGLMLSAEIMARARRRGMAALFIPTSSVANICIRPSTKFQHSFQIDCKLDRIYQENHYLICIQSETELESGNFLVLRIDEAGRKIGVYAVYSQKPVPFLITEVAIEYDGDISEDVQRLQKLCLSELALMAQNSAPSGFGVLG